MNGAEQAPEYSGVCRTSDGMCWSDTGQKKWPQRTCVGCGVRREQREMLRIAAVPGCAPVIDKLFTAPGRGAYLCRQLICIEKALSRRALERSLKLKNGVPASLRDDIMKVLSTTL